MSTTYKKSAVNLEHAKFVKERETVLIDASNLIVGRLAAQISQFLIGKHKLNFTQGVDCGDRVVVINSDLVKFTSNKLKTKKYYRHTGYAGGIKETTPQELLNKDKSDEIIFHAVKGMLPKNTLGRNMLKNLRIFPNETYDSFGGAKIAKIDIASINKKNVL